MISKSIRAFGGPWLAALLTMFVILAFPAGPAEAHAVLVSSSPSQGERLAAPPAAVRLRFSEPVAHPVLTLTDRFGRMRSLTAVASGVDVSAQFPARIADGAYALNWSVVSEDGHPVRAAVVFSIGRGAEMQDLTRLGSVRDLGLAMPVWAARAAYCALALFGVGGTFFSFWIGGGLPGRWTAASLAVGVALAGLSLVLFGLDSSGLGWSGLFDARAWQAALYGSFARSVGLLAASMLLAAAAVARPRHGRWLALAAFLAIGPAFALTGHAADTGVRWLSASVVSIHVAAACFWAGSLPRLWSILDPGKRGCPEVLARFSAAIPYSVAALSVGGIYLAWLELGSFDALWRTAYGNVLAAKVAMVGATLALAAYNRFRLTRGVLRGEEDAVRSMRRIVFGEIVLLVLVLSVTSLWRFTPPPRGLALESPAFASVHMHKPSAMATLSFRTAQDLAFDVEVSIVDAGFDAFDPKEVSMTMSSSEGSVAPFDVPLRRKALGQWSARRVQAPCNCEWKVGVKVLVSDFEIVGLEGRVKLRPQD